MKEAARPAVRPCRPCRPTIQPIRRMVRSAARPTALSAGLSTALPGTTIGKSNESYVACSAEIESISMRMSDQVRFTYL